MDHASQIRLVPGAKHAVLFLHGIVGTPRHFSHILNMVDCVPDSWSYYNLLLDGHGGTVSDFSRSSMKKWKVQVWSVFHELLTTHDSVVIVGHSMGTLFALQLAVEFPNKIPLLFLIGCPIRPWVGAAGMNCSLRAMFGLCRKDRPAESAILEAGGTVLTKKVWKYIPWIKNMISLLLEASHTERLLPKLQTKTLAFQSRRDEMVSNSSGKVLKRYSVVEVTTFEDSTHFYYSQGDKERIYAAFSNGCRWVSNRDL